ncbi:MAG: rod shape-determining protein MreC [Bacteroidales bacterium]|nr:rod shape-determining protein MreC [Bacteroidales bacterium]MBN2699597.1 rod shape-determining protein MreC [Bacteroidales bacterium]
MQKLLNLIKKYSYLLLFLILETVAVILLANGSYFQQSRIHNFNRNLSGFIYSRVGNAREYLSLKKVNEALVLENRTLRNRLEVFSRMIDTASVGKKTREDYTYFYVPARVVHSSVFKQYNFLTLNRGKKHGVFKDMGVVSDQGLVGIVLESSKNYSTVIPVINRNFRLSAKIKSNNYAGIIVWEGDSPVLASLQEIPYHVSLHKGDTIVTSGFSAIFPEGIPVGTIESFTLEKGNFYDITIRLFTTFQNLFHVNVIRNYYREEQKQLERNITG